MRSQPAVAGGGVGRPNFEDPGNYEPKPPESLQLEAVWGIYMQGAHSLYIAIQYSRLALALQLQLLH
jgi:hypothetical protein